MLKPRGSYNVSAATQSMQQRPALRSGEHLCYVEPLGRERLEFVVTKQTLGSVIFDEVTRILELEVEQDYFGLRVHVEKYEMEDAISWVELTRPITEQIRGKTIELDFCVQYYPLHPDRLVDEYSRYLVFLQVLEDMYFGRFRCSEEITVKLLAFTAQSYLGNYDASVHKPGYISEIPFLPVLTEEQRNTIFLRHVELVDMTASEAENAFLRLAAVQTMYGLDLYSVRHDASKSTVYLGVGAAGVSLLSLDAGTFLRAEMYRWSSVSSAEFASSKFVLHIINADSMKQTHSVNFTCPNRRVSKRLWKSVVRHHTFFRRTRSRVKPSSAIGRVLLNRRSALERSGFFGLTEKETSLTAEKSVRSERSINRCSVRSEQSPLRGASTRMRTNAFEQLKEESSADHDQARGKERPHSLMWEDREGFERMESFQGDSVLTETKFLDEMSAPQLIKSPPSGHPAAASTPALSSSTPLAGPATTTTTTTTTAAGYTPSSSLVVAANGGPQASPSTKRASQAYPRLSIPPPPPPPRASSAQDLDALPPPPMPETAMELELLNGGMQMKPRSRERTVAETHLDSREQSAPPEESLGSYVEVVFGAQPASKAPAAAEDHVHASPSLSAAGAGAAAATSSSKRSSTEPARLRGSVVSETSMDSSQSDVGVYFTAERGRRRPNESSTDDYPEEEETERGAAAEDLDVSAARLDASMVTLEPVELKPVEAEESVLLGGPAVAQSFRLTASQATRFGGSQTSLVIAPLTGVEDVVTEVETFHSSQVTMGSSKPQQLETGGGLSEGHTDSSGVASIADHPIEPVKEPLGPLLDGGDVFLPPTPFYARALVAQSGADGLLAFAPHDILRINDTSSGDCWPAENLTAGGSGLVMSEKRHLNSVQSSTSDPLLQSIPLRAYQPIHMQPPEPGMVRPVVILGPSKDHIIDRLVLDYPEVFHTCVPHTTRPQRPEECDALDYHFVSLPDFEARVSRGEFAETLRFQNYLYGTSFAAIQTASAQGGYCVLDVSDPHTIASLEEASMYPISIFLRPVSVQSIMEQNPHLSREAAELVFAKTLELEQLFRGRYSAIIDNDNFESAYYKVYHAILAEAGKPVWVPTYAASDAAGSVAAHHGGDGNTDFAARKPELHAADSAPASPSRAAAATTTNTTAHPDGEASTAASSPATSPSKLSRRRSRSKSFVGTELIRLEKAKTGGLGFSFAGGVDTPSSPGDPAIYVTKIAPGGVAEQDGRLQVGDRLVEVNEVSMASVTHVRAGEILRDSGAQVRLKVTRKCRRVKLRAENGVFGLGIKGGADSGSPVVISRVADDSPAAQHPRLQLGFEITHVNNTPVRDLTHAQVLDMIRNCKEELDLVVHPRRSRSLRKRPLIQEPASIGAVEAPSTTALVATGASSFSSAPAQAIPADSTGHPSGNNSTAASSAAATTTTVNNSNNNPSDGGQQDLANNPFFSAAPSASHITAAATTTAAAATAPVRSQSPKATARSSSPPPAAPEERTAGAAKPQPAPRIFASVPAAPARAVASANTPPPPPPPPTPAESSANPFFGAASETKIETVPGNAPPMQITPTDPASLEDNRRLRGGNFNAIPIWRRGYTREAGSKIALAPANAGRNRYKDILPYDDIRVRLKSADNDYVNASPVVLEGPGFRLSYIASQGPKDNTAEHFWQMVHENNVSVICMLTTLTEGGRPKCFQYWPAAVGEALALGPYSVRMAKEENHGAFVHRTLALQAPGAAVRQVQHVQFLAWPDHGVPEDGSTFLRYMEYAQNIKQGAASRTAPVVVHCSAGIGRTGVFCALEASFALFERNCPVDLAELVRRMREQRVGMVQTEGQFQFIYKVLAASRRGDGPGFSIVTNS